MRLPLKVAIIATGRSQREIARDINISENRLSEIVRGWTEPTSAERKALAGVLARPEDTLFEEGATIEIRSLTR